MEASIAKQRRYIIRDELKQTFAIFWLQTLVSSPLKVERKFQSTLPLTPTMINRYTRITGGHERHLANGLEAPSLSFLSTHLSN